ncbi:MAG: hypothetical protein A3I03_01365 [Candidatus Rokubacteria bacterium RIFCSPLOWO2_02_FULL_68_19]|nr:MAG: hypothetical protein A3I03_01365 [Candidatus Rokubacteria bacterium RIFCSPLOWO2_02_FULL_68_19]
MGARSLLIALVLVALAGGAVAAPPEEAIVALDKYTTEKARTLATTFSPQLRRIYNQVYHCRPWLDVRKGGLGFTRAVGHPGDDRFLNIWVWVEQEITPEFAALATPARRASAMFSRHGVDLLRQLAADAGIFANPALAGYSVILTWIKPSGRVGNEEVAETLGVFADKSAVQAFLAKQISAREFVEKATIVAFDGKDRLGQLPLEVWEDNFATTFKLKNYEPEDKSLGC